MRGLLIATSRLELRAVTAETALAASEKDGESLARALGVRVPEDWPPRIDDDGAMARAGFAFVHDRLKDDSSLVGWWGWFVLLKADEPLLIGSVSPKGPPDPEGRVEVAYGIISSQQRKGFATEATRALIGWVKRDVRTRSIVAETLPHLQGSIGVMKRCGLAFMGEGSESGTIRYGADAAPL